MPTYYKLLFLFLGTTFFVSPLGALGKPEMPYDGIIPYSDIPGLVMINYKNKAMGVQEEFSFFPIPMTIVPGVMGFNHLVLTSPDEVIFEIPSFESKPDQSMVFWNRKDFSTKRATFSGRVYAAFEDKDGAVKYLIRNKTTHLGFWRNGEFITEELQIPFMNDYLFSYGNPQDGAMERHRRNVLEKGEDSVSFEMFQEVKPGVFLIKYSDRIFFWNRKVHQVNQLLSMPMVMEWNPPAPNIDHTYSTSVFEGEHFYFTFNRKIYSYYIPSGALNVVRDFSEWMEKYHGTFYRIDFKSPTEYLIYGGRGEVGKWWQHLSYWVSGDKMYKIDKSVFLGRTDNNYVAFRKE